MRKSLRIKRITNGVARLSSVSRSIVGLILLGSIVVAGLASALGQLWLVVISVGMLGIALLHVYGIVRAVLVRIADQDGLADIVVSGSEADPPSEKPGALSKSIGAKEQTELVTVVVPLFNEERFIRDCLQSIRNQTWKKWRCIVVDDASTDGGSDIVEQMRLEDDRIEFTRHQRNSGLSASRNTGLRMAGSELITFLDSDDMLLPKAIEDRVLELRKYRKVPSVAGAYCGIVQVKEETALGDRPPYLDYPGGFQDVITAQADCPFSVHAPLVKTHILRALGGFDESMKNGAEDWDLWQKVLRHGYLFRSTATIGGLYRRKRNSMVSTLSTAHISEAARIYANASTTLPVVYTEEGVVPLPAPVHEYPLALRFTKRLITFAAMAYVTGGEEGLSQVLENLPEAARSFLLRHFKIEPLVSTGVKRALALPEELSGDVKKRHDELVALVVASIRKRLEQADDGTVIVEQPRVVDVLFFVTDAYEANTALDIYRLEDKENSDVSFAVLAPDAVNGNQGAAALTAANGIRTYSVNEFLLKRPTLKNVIVFRKRAYGIETLLEIASEDGASVCYLDAELSTDPGDAGLHPGIHRVHDFAEVKTLATMAGERQNPVSRDRGYLKAIPSRFKYRPDVLRREELFDKSPDTEKLRSFKDKHQGERCVIVGNGPSLNDMDLARLAGEHTIAVNGIFYKTEEVGFKPEYYVVEDSSVMKENIDAIRAYDVPFKFFPTHYSELHPADENVSFFRMNRGFYETKSPNFCVPRFSVDFSDRAYCGQSVTYINLQLAYYMGFSEVYLIGMDFSYVIPESAIVDGDLILSTEDDPNHFNAAYFGKGKTWKDPKLDRVLQNYKAAQRMYEAAGRKIFNATLGGKLELFERIEFNSVFGNSG